jgi:transforming growth factor-beta-induced protein
MRTSRSRLALVAMALTLALAGAACSSDETASPPETASAAPSGPACGAVPGEGPGSFSALASEPVATAAASSRLLTTLATAVTDAGLAETLDGEGPFTVFAPANSAFGEIPSSDLDALLGNKEALTEVLTYHVVEGALTPDELIEAGTVDSLQGQPLTIAEDGDNLTVDGAKVLCGNIPVENGVVYVIDEVLQPDTDATPVSGPVGPLCQAIPADAVAALADLPVGDAAGQVGQLATLTTAVGAADLGGTLNGEGPFIVFAPVEDAFAAVPADTLSGLLEDPEALANVLTYHVVAGEQTAQQLVQEGSVETVQGGDVEILKDGESFTVNGADVLCGPITVANGTVYLIDSVLLPSA